VAGGVHHGAGLRAAVGTLLAVPSLLFLVYALADVMQAKVIFPAAAASLSPLDNLPTAAAAAILFGCGFICLVIGLWFGREFDYNWNRGLNVGERRKKGSVWRFLISVVFSLVGFPLVLLSFLKAIGRYDGQPFRLADNAEIAPIDPWMAAMTIAAAAALFIGGLLLLRRAGPNKDGPIQAVVLVAVVLACCLIGSPRSGLPSAVIRILQRDWTGLDAHTASWPYEVAFFVPVALFAYAWVSYQAWRRHKMGPSPKPLVMGG
jgi:hypothetical protein